MRSREQVRTGKAAVVGAMYDVTTGQVEFLDYSTPVAEVTTERLKLKVGS